MYKQRPAYPALMAALFVLLLGGSIVCWMKQRVDEGLIDASKMLFAGCMTCGIAGVLIVSALARYQFLHLWKKPPRAVGQKNPDHTHSPRF